MRGGKKEGDIRKEDGEEDWERRRSLERREWNCQELPQNLNRGERMTGE